MNDEKGVERRFGPGDIAFFPAGSNATWRHPDHFRKVAILKESVWRPLGIGLKLWNKLLRMIGITDTSPLLQHRCRLDEVEIPVSLRTSSLETRSGVVRLT